MKTNLSRLRSVSLLSFAIGLAVFSTLLSCANPGGSSTGGPDDGNPPATPKTLAWQDDGAGYIEYYTNDSANIQSQGYSAWHYYDPSETTMSTVEVKVKKINGDPTMGFGVIFCVQDASNFMMVTIDTTGFYHIGKIAAGNYTSLTDPSKTVPVWIDSAGVLYTGYNVSNTINITYNSGSKVFTLKLNGTQAATFTDPGAPFFTGGRSGFVIGISDSENFPDDPVDIKFKRTLPLPTVP